MRGFRLRGTLEPRPETLVLTPGYALQSPGSFPDAEACVQWDLNSAI